VSCFWQHGCYYNSQRDYFSIVGLWSFHFLNVSGELESKIILDCFSLVFPENGKYLISYICQHDWRLFYKSQRGWFFHNFDMKLPFLPFVSGKLEWKFIKNSAFYSVSIVFHWLKSNLWFISCNTDTIIKSKRLFSHNLDMEFPFLLSVSEELEWNFIKRKEYNGFCWVSLIFHRLKSKLWIISDNMDAIIKSKRLLFYGLDMKFTFLQSVSEVHEWKIIKIQYYSAFHCVS